MGINRLPRSHWGVFGFYGRFYPAPSPDHHPAADVERQRRRTRPPEAGQHLADCPDSPTRLVRGGEVNLSFLGMAPATANLAWRVANLLAIAAAIGSCVEGFAQAPAKVVVGLTGLFSALAMCITYIAGSVRERASRAELESARLETERLRERIARRNLTDGQRAALIKAAKGEGPLNIWVPHVASDHEASEYAKQLRNAFAEAGWNTGYAALQVGTPMYGLVVGMSPPFTAPPEPSAIERVRRVLATAGITSTVTETFPPNSPAFGWSAHPGPDAAVLLVASKPSKPDPLG